MPANPDPRSDDTRPDAPRRHGSVRRTTLVLVAIVVAIYVAFILSGVVGR